MKTLFTGIYNLYAGDLATYTTGLYPYEAPQGTAMPYVVYSLVADAPEQYFAETLDLYQVQFL